MFAQMVNQCSLLTKYKKSVIDTLLNNFETLHLTLFVFLVMLQITMKNKKEK